MITIDLAGAVVLVTGARDGIGAGTASRFRDAGATVVAHGGRADGDLADPAIPRQLVADAVSAHGRLDAVVNNAGLQPVTALGDVSDDEWQAMLDINVTAAHRLTVALADHAGSRDGSGAVVHIASIEGLNPAHGHGHYAVSKAALLMHAKTAALEFGQRGVRVNAVSPGLVDRHGLEEAWPDGVGRWLARAPLGRLGNASDIGDACVFLCSPMASWITGANLVVDGGVTANPTW